MRALEAARATRRIDRSRRELNAALGEEQAFALVGTGRSLWTTNDSELERRDGTLAFPSEDERYPGQCSLHFS